MQITRVVAQILSSRGYDDELVMGEHRRCSGLVVRRTGACEEPPQSDE